MPRNNRFDHTRRAESNLLKGLATLKKQVAKIVAEAKTPDEIVKRIAALGKTKYWQKLALSEARRMIKGIQTQTAANWREAAVQSQKPQAIYKSLREATTSSKTFEALIESNAQFFKTIPENLAKTVTKHISTEAVKGLRFKELMPYLKQKAPQLTEAQIKRIARTETAKAQAAVTEIQAEKAGIRWYTWKTSEDKRVRTSHAHMDEVLVKWSDPPAPEVLVGEKSEGHYNAGNIYNCRCTALPLVDPVFLDWPQKVYHNGRISSMTEAQFRKIQ